MHRLVFVVLLLLTSTVFSQPAPTPAPCPEGLPTGTTCMIGTDGAGAHYRIALPAQWDRQVLVLHAHGGPLLGTPTAERATEDLLRWQIMVRAGYAWAASVFRQGGVEVRAAAEDTEALRKIFIEHIGPPRRTILHGNSWGAGVAAKGAEIFPASYDALLLTSGVLAGGSRSYDFRLDLRVIYQAVCANHPRPDEPQYPLWQGLPPNSKLGLDELTNRVDDCTGVRRKPAERSALQQRNLDTLLKTVRIPESSLIGHLNWATRHFQDIVFKRLGGGNPFGNIGARYVGSPDDDALNKQVERYRPDPVAAARFAADTDPTGRVKVPVLTTHAINDPIAFVEFESHFRATMDSAGNGQRLVQTYIDEAEHSYLGDSHYPALMQALLAWVDQGEKPTPQRVADRCKALEPQFATPCRFVPGYTPAPLDARVTPRQR